jgi:hypothetical protein
MMNRSFRLNQETQGTVAGESHRVMVVIPEGSEIALIGEVAEQPESVEILWNGQSVWLFATDFKTRSVRDNNTVALTNAASVGGEAVAPPVAVKADVKSPLAPKVRRFNAAGRELF